MQGGPPCSVGLPVATCGRDERKTGTELSASSVIPTSLGQMDQVAGGSGLPSTWPLQWPRLGRDSHILVVGLT